MPFLEDDKYVEYVGLHLNTLYLTLTNQGHRWNETKINEIYWLNNKLLTIINK